MIFVIMLIVAVAFMGVCGEVYYERDWPRMTWLRLVIAVALLFGGMAVFAQGVRVDSNVTTSASNVPSGAQAPVYTVPFAKVYVCSYPAAPSNAPCTNTVPIFSDAAMTQPITQPLIADGKGRYGFTVAAGSYAYSFSSSTGTYLGTSSFNAGGGASGGGFIAASGANGIANALQTCVPGQPCGVNAPIGYAQGDTTIPTGDGQVLVDNSSGSYVKYFNNPFSSPRGIGQQFDANFCNQQRIHFGWNDSSTYDSSCGLFNMNLSAPGVTYGYGAAAGFSAVGWTIAHVISAFGQFNGGGLHGGINTTIRCASATDCNNYNYMTVSGDCADPSCEGANVSASSIGEDFLAYTGTIAAGSTTTQLYLNPLTNVDQMASTRYMVPTLPTYTGYATAIATDSQDSGRITVLTDANANFPVSTFSGQLTFGLQVDNQLGFLQTPTPTFTVCEYMRFNSGFTGSMTPGLLIAFDDSFQETAAAVGPHCMAWVSTKQYANGEGAYYGGTDWIMLHGVPNVGEVPGVGPDWGATTAPSGGYQYAAMLGQSHSANTRVEGGGYAGYGIDFVANEANPSGTQPLIYPAPIIGSPDNHSLHLVQFLKGNSVQGYKLGAVDMGQHTLQSLVVTSGVAQMVFYESQIGQLERAPIVTVTTATPSSLNGQYQLPTNNVGPTGFGATFSATKCTSGTGINGVACVADTLTASATNNPVVTVGTTGYGNSNYRVRPMAKVLDANDYRVPGQVTALGTAAVLEPNPGLGAVGTAVTETHLYSQRIDAMKLSVGMWNRNTLSDGTILVNVTGNGLVSGTGIGIPQAIMRFTGGPDASALVGGGGNGTPPDVFTNIIPTLGSVIRQRFAPWNNRPIIDMSEDGFLPDPTLQPFNHTALVSVRTHVAAGGTTVFNLMDWNYKTGFVSLCSGGCQGLGFYGQLLGQSAPNAQGVFCTFLDSSGHQNCVGGTYSSVNVISNDGGSNDLVQFFLGVNPNSSTVPTNATYKFAPTGMTAPGYSTTGTTPGQMSLAAGTGSIPALPANSAGFAAPATGGTAYLLKLPATITAGALTVAAPATGDGVNESVITVVSGFSGHCASGTSPTYVNGIAQGPCS